MELPLHDRDTADVERADAARNRQRILAAAARLFADRPVEEVSMDDVAREAGVGKGTLYRRFGDRSTLVRTLLSEREGAFQEQLIRGRPPLGPGAPPEERLRAFGPGLMGLLECHGQLMLASESGRPMHRLQSNVYAFYRVHVGLLLTQAAPWLDVDYAADALLAPLSAEFFVYLREQRGLPLERLQQGWLVLLDGVLATP